MILLVLSRSISRLPTVLLWLALGGPAFTQPAIERTGALLAPEAKQAAAADDRFVYAIDSKVIAKYARSTGDRLAVSTGSATHLNSGFLWEGKLYCAHSNYPQKPEKSELMILHPETMVLSTFKDFGDYRGSLTWVVREGSEWWCNFARYGKENAQTVLVRMTDNWRELGAWTYPESVIKDLGQYSVSGGIWREGQLLVTGHDRKLIYRLKLPAAGDVLELIDILPSPFPGQGIASDPKTSGLVGVDRAKQCVVFGDMKH